METLTAFESEAIIIGALVRDESLLIEAAVELDEHDFSDPNYAQMFKVLCSFLAEGGEVDAAILADRLPKTDECMKLLRYGAEMAEGISDERLRRHIEIVAGYAKLRHAHGIIQDAMQQIVINGMDGSEIAEQNKYLRERITDALTKLDAHDRYEALTPSEAAERMAADIEKPRNYMRTGFKSVDKDVHISRGDYIILGGRPSSGKTALSLQMMVEISKRHNVLYFSLETSPEKLMRRIFACQTSSSYSLLLDGRRRDELAATVRKAAWDSFNFRIIPAAGYDVAKITSAALKYKADIVFIDYLGLIQCERASRYEQITQISIDLHTFAQKHGIAVFALSQLSRQGGTGKADMATLRESGQLEQDADVVLMLTNDSPDTRILTISKNKDGKCSDINMEFIGTFQKFKEMPGELKRGA